MVLIESRLTRLDRVSRAKVVEPIGGAATDSWREEWGEVIKVSIWLWKTFPIFPLSFWGFHIRHIRRLHKLYTFMCTL